MINIYLLFLCLKNPSLVSIAKLQTILFSLKPNYIRFVPRCILNTFGIEIDTNGISKVKKNYCGSK